MASDKSSHSPFLTGIAMDGMTIKHLQDKLSPVNEGLAYKHIEQAITPPTPAPLPAPDPKTTSKE